MSSYFDPFKFVALIDQIGNKNDHDLMVSFVAVARKKEWVVTVSRDSDGVCLLRCVGSSPSNACGQAMVQLRKVMEAWGYTLPDGN